MSGGFRFQTTRYQVEKAAGESPFWAICVTLVGHALWSVRWAHYDLDPKLNELESVDKHAALKWELIFTLMAWPSSLSFGWSQTEILSTESPRGPPGHTRTKLQERRVTVWLTRRLCIIACKWPAWNITQDQYIPGKRVEEMNSLSVALEIMALSCSILQVVYNIFFSFISQVSN